MDPLAESMAPIGTAEGDLLGNSRRAGGDGAQRGRKDPAWPRAPASGRQLWEHHGAVFFDPVLRRLEHCFRPVQITEGNCADLRFYMRSAPFAKGTRKRAAALCALGQYVRLAIMNRVLPSATMEAAVVGLEDKWGLLRLFEADTVTRGVKFFAAKLARSRHEHFASSLRTFLRHCLESGHIEGTDEHSAQEAAKLRLEVRRCCLELLDLRTGRPARKRAPADRSIEDPSGARKLELSHAGVQVTSADSAGPPKRPRKAVARGENDASMDDTEPACNLVATDAGTPPRLHRIMRMIRAGVPALAQESSPGTPATPNATTETAKFCGGAPAVDVDGAEPGPHRDMDGSRWPHVCDIVVTIHAPKYDHTELAVSVNSGDEFQRGEWSRTISPAGRSVDLSDSLSGSSSGSLGARSGASPSDVDDARTASQSGEDGTAHRGVEDCLAEFDLVRTERPTGSERVCAPRGVVDQGSSSDGASGTATPLQEPQPLTEREFAYAEVADGDSSSYSAPLSTSSDEEEIIVLTDGEGDEDRGGVPYYREGRGRLGNLHASVGELCAEQRVIVLD